MVNRKVNAGLYDTPATGLYRNVPFDRYLGWDAVSNSSMQPALRSMAHYRECPGIEETPAMRLGTLTHAGRFEPERIVETYVVMPAYENQVRREDGSKFDSPKNSAAYRELVDEFKLRTVDKTIVSSSEFEMMRQMVRALAEDEQASAFLTGGDYEVSIVASDPVTGLLCKGRIDHLHALKHRIGDLKTCRDASHFNDVIEDRSYFRQMAFYVDLCKWMPKPIRIDEVSIVAVENTRPHCVRSAEIDEDWLDDGRSEYRRILNQIAKCLKSRKWPGYGSPEKWVRPSWAKKTAESVSLKVGGKVMKFTS